MSDAVFFDSSTLSEAQIQSFLESKVSSCRSGYTCLKDYYVQTRSIAADPMCGAYSGGGMERASRVIYKVAQACGINPQVIIVMLQKEQGLITSTAPSSWAYQAAMGQGCPDTAACDTAYYGLFNQVYGGARQMKRYANPPGTSNYFTWYAPGNTWNVQYHPNTGCGRSPVYIENQATANLYYYTPYQPNAAALRAGYGEGDGCSSYGNRNFFNYFTDWFGSTHSIGGDPVGQVSGWTLTNRGVRVTGWIVDPDTNGPVSFRVKSNEVLLTRGSADIDSPELPREYAYFGSMHGFDVEVPLAPGSQQVCVAANNTGAGTNRTIGCAEIVPTGTDPFGDVVWEPTATGVRVSGWAVDPETLEPISLRFKVGAERVERANADINVAALAGVIPTYGTRHGFDTEIQLGPIPVEVCVAANNVGSGVNRTLGCETVTVLGGDPIGGVDPIEVVPGGVRVSGWVIDPDTSGATSVRIKDGSTQLVRVTADGERSDLGEYAGYGSAHGFEAELALSPGMHTLCVAANNVGSGVNRTLGCETVTVLGGDPFGYITDWVVSPGGVRVKGWVIDPDTADPVTIRVKSGGETVLRSAADISWAYLADSYPGYGSAHAFDVEVSLPVGISQVCVAANNVGSGVNRTLGCETVTVLGGTDDAALNG